MSATNTPAHSKMRAAIIQMQCDDTGNKQANIDLIEKLVGECCNGWAESTIDMPSVVLLPELATSGYTFDKDTLWPLGEPSRVTDPSAAVTENLLCSLASKHKAYVGCSYLEASPQEDNNFFNTFALAGPDGNIKGRVRKSRPAGVEANLFAATTKESSTPHVIETEDGLRFGVLICFENYVSACIAELQGLSTPLDIMLCPFSGPLYEPKMELYNDRVSFISQAMYAPTLYVNKWGKWTRSEFPGQCAMADADGNVLVRMPETGDAFEVREVVLGRAVRAEREAASTPDPLGGKRPVVSADRRFAGGSWVMWLTIPLEFFGKRSYASAAPKRKELMTKLVPGLRNSAL